MKFWRIVSVVGGVLVVLGYVKITEQLYHYWEQEAVREVAKTKRFRTVCQGDNPFDCTFTEIPVHVNRLADIYFPTGACAVLILAAIIAAIVWLYRTVSQVSV